MPSQFWELTPREFQFQIDGYHWRDEREQWRIASVVAAIYDVQRDPKKRRKPITAADIIGKKAKPAGARTAEAQKAILDALVARTAHLPRRPRAATR